MEAAIVTAISTIGVIITTIIQKSIVIKSSFCQARTLTNGNLHAILYLLYMNSKAEAKRRKAQE